MRRVLRWACRKNQTQALIYLFQFNSLTFAKNIDLGAEALYYACIKGETSLAASLLDAGVSPNPPVTRGHSFLPLEVAVMHNQTKVVEILTAAGAKLGSSDFIANFSILCRGKPDRLATAQILVKHELDINQVDQNGNNFLHHACRRAASAATTLNAELLLDLGLDVNQPNDNGETPLILAARANSPSLINFLLSRGADVNAVSPDGQSPLLASLEDTHGDPYETVRCLLHAGATITKDSGLELVRRAFANTWPLSLAQVLQAWKSQLSSLHCSDPNILFCAAAAVGDIHLLRDLLQLDEVDPNCEVESRTALVAAAEAGKDDAIEFLIPHVSNYDNNSQGGRTALHIAIRRGTEQTVRLLLPHTTTTRLDGISLRSLLLNAVDCQSATVVSLLLDKIWSPAQESSQSVPEEATDTPSSKSGLEDAPVILLPALRFAVGRGKLEIVRVLLRRSNIFESERKTSRLLTTAITARQEEIALELLKWGVSPEKEEGMDSTPLMMAAEVGLVRLVRALLDKNVDPHYKSALQETAMTLAVHANHPDVVRCLLAADASPHELVHVRHESELDYHRHQDNLFIHAVKKGYVDIVRALAPFFDVNELTVHERHTALHLAISQGHVEVVRALLATGRVRLARRSRSGKTALDYAKDSRFRFPRDILEKLSARKSGAAIHPPYSSRLTGL
ncbi:ankyrin repeat domain-containing protein [Aspergillus lucknowensis]|uniref:Ankyrin repeat-containing domain protein n=1 Tax=Aspergillus lucknowensis TaxID=176173 RepID=A0ABR4M7L4_9EURO